MTCRSCSKRSGWLFSAIPAYLLLPKCPLCLIAYLAIVPAAFFRHSEAPAGALLVIAGLILLFRRWRDLLNFNL